MNSQMTQVLFALLRSAVCGEPIRGEEASLFDESFLPEMIAMAEQHDVAHLLAVGLQKNGLLDQEYPRLERATLKAVFRYERLSYELERLRETLESAGVDFMPLKGSVLREKYPEPWMRTSCDIDVLVHKKDVASAVEVLVKTLGYTKKEQGPRDVSLFSSEGNHIELHFDLIREGGANNAAAVLRSVWEQAVLKPNTHHHYEMTDAYFYFYHIAHMAKHFEIGGCGIRPFVDTWILDRVEGIDSTGREVLLKKGDLFRFAEAARKLSRIWFEGEEADALSVQMQEFLLHGGVYGSADNRVALRQKEKGGRLGYLFSRVFAPYAKLKRYYPILEKHPWLFPVMQVRRWFMIFRPDVARMAKGELAANRSVESAKSEELQNMLKDIGL